jgi:hypothetical protein
MVGKLKYTLSGLNPVFNHTSNISGYKAKYGSDYTLSSTGSVTFEAGSSHATLTFNAVDDNYIQ